MKLQFVIMILMIGSCNYQTQERTQEVRSADSSGAFESTAPANDSVAMRDKGAAYGFNNPSYKEYLPATLKNYLVSHLADWQLPDPESWEKQWFDSYRSKNSLVNFVSSDFNCDEQTDYALLLLNRLDSSIGAWVVQSGTNEFTSVKLTDFDRFRGHIQVGLQIIEPGAINYIDPDSEKGFNTTMLKCPAVQVTYFETAARTYYWNNGKYNQLQTGD